MQLDARLALESARVNRNSVASLEKFLEAYTPHLHPNHAFLAQLKMWLCEGKSN